MGVPGPKTTQLEDLGKRFSDDILKIELSGPNYHHFSVVHVPGLFHNPTPFQTQEERAIIRETIERYMNDKRTIILAVMDAVNNLANQEVFSMARLADPAGQRTVGIITKCDILQGCDEMRVMRIAQNEVERLAHGWFVVKNRSTKNIMDGVTIEDRHLSEKSFFDTKEPWTALRKDRVGVAALSTFLGPLLYNHTHSEFPSLQKDIETRLIKEQKALEAFGPSRQGPADQREYLMSIASKYQEKANQALEGDYDPDLQRNNPLKLRMHIRSINDQLSVSLRNGGQLNPFYSSRDTLNARISPPEHDLDHVMSEDTDQNQNDSIGMYEWIRIYYRESRGAELAGTISSPLPETLFRRLSTPWEAIAKNYIEISSAFNAGLLEALVVDENVRKHLLEILTPREEMAYARASDQLAVVLQDERGGVLQTANHYFADTLTSIRHERMKARLDYLDSRWIQGDEYVKSANIQEKLHLGNEERAIYDTHDTLKAYYKVALNRFVDNLIIRVMERHLLGEGGSLKTLTPELVGGMSEARLAEIAGENVATESKRSDLKAKVARMQEASRIARGVGG